MPVSLYFLELLATISPYLFGLTALGVILSLIAVSYQPNIISSWLFWSVLSVSIIGAFLTGTPVIKFIIHFPAASVLAEDHSKTLTLVTFNKLYSNSNYRPIDQAISDLNPDILVMTELRPSDIPNIPSLGDYPFRQSKPSRDKATVSLFSKYPFSVNQDFNSEFILPVNIQINQKSYQLFALHPKPIISPSWTTDRNTEIEKLVSYIESNNEKETIIMGDFNMTPWSPAYSSLAKVSAIKNVALGKGIFMTTKGGLFNAQIDHIFIPNSWSVEQFGVVDVKGSDHNLIWAKVQL